MMKLIQVVVMSLSVTVAYAQTSFRDLSWEDLIPEVELETMSRMMQLTRNPHGIPLDPDRKMSDQIDEAMGIMNDPDYDGLMNSINVRNELNQQDIRLPGYVVPVDIGADSSVTAFFLVPYYGACIHVPPPSPNQIVFVIFKEGLKMDELWKPYYVSGTLFTEMHESDLATTAYSMTAATVEEYPVQ
jgi:hypothetical protein